MCRSIKVLRVPEAPATPEEISAAALQFVRKVSGYRAPSKVNQPAFDAAVKEIARSTTHLLNSLHNGPKKQGTDHTVPSHLNS